MNIPSLYFDLMVSNTKKATVEIRNLHGCLYAYTVTVHGAKPEVRGSVECHGDNPVLLSAMVLADYQQYVEQFPSAAAKTPSS